MTEASHVHRPTGEIRECSGEGCPESFPVVCHSGRLYCTACRQGRRRAADRAAKRRRRARARDDSLARSAAREWTDPFSLTVSEARKLTANLGYNREQFRAYLDRLYEDDPYEDDDLGFVQQNERSADKI